MKIISPLLNKETLACWKFMGSDPKEFRQTFGEFLSLEQIPVRYGGSRKLRIDDM
jgi:hypothetical protein